MDKAGSLTLPAQNDAYTYDALDNRTKKTVNGVDQYAVFDAANQLVELRNGSPTGALTHAFVYDANGNLIQKCEGTGVSRTTTTCSGSTVSSFTWNPDDQLIAFYKPGVSESYQYDQAGRRIAKTSNGVTTYYRYNGDDIDAEYSATWSETARYVHGPNTDDPLMRLTGQTNDPSATAIYYHQDGIGSVVATSDQAGNIVAAQLFDAWGNRVQSTGSIAQYGYTGREPDQSGMIYYRARYYDPTLGRFISRDPAGMPNGVNRYAYVNNNPINATDPTGLYAKQYNTNSNTANIGYTADLSSFGQTYSSGSYNLGSNQSSAAIGEQNPWALPSGGATLVARADIDVWPRQGGGFNYRASDDQGSKPLQGTFNTGTSININQLPTGNYSVSPRPAVPEPGFFGGIRDLYLGDRNRNAGRPTISNTNNWNQIRFPDGSLHEGVQIHPGRSGTNGGNSLGCLVCTQSQFNSLNQMFQKNYDNGGVHLNVLPQAPR
ncbi:MAG: RHS repeat-associated core domain-containing protein [Pseudomonadota bacterium]